LVKSRGYFPLAFFILPKKLNMHSFIKTGVITRTRGKDGGLVMETTTDYAGLIPRLRALFVEIKPDKVPYLTTKIHQQSATSFFIRLEGIDNMDKATRLKGCDVYAATKDIPDEFLKNRPPDLTGYQVTDRHEGLLGKVAAIESFPGQDMLHIAGDKKEWLVPFVEAYIVKIEPEKKLLTLELPEGFFDML
jgi:16S rRNA processing protein RimM